MEELKGVVDTIIFRSDETGYTVAEVEVNKKLITCVGLFCHVNEGEEVTLTGEYKVNQKFGRQFDVKKIKVNLPSTNDAMIKYLASGLFKGVGPVTAFSIVEKFQGNTLKVIENEPQKLSKVRGISTKKATEISESFQRLKNMQDKILYLQSLGITINMAIKIYKIYEEKTEEIVKQNPYKLVEDIVGIGFSSADRIAEKIGIEKDSLFRIKAAVLHTLKDAAASNGHSYLPLETLLVNAEKLLGFFDKGDLIRSAIDELMLSDTVKTYQKSNHYAVALAMNFNLEKSIAQSLVDINHSSFDEIDSIKDLDAYEQVNDIKLHPNQRTAIQNVLKSGISVITGGPGTGKTTIIKAVLSVLKNRKENYVLAAPTGRAAKRLSLTTGEDAKTIHRLLEIDVKNGKMKFVYNERNKLDYDVVIVDEMSMVDVYVFAALTKALKKGTRLILVGDKDQLPSVGSGNVLSDIIDCGLFGVNYLTFIYRQESESLIISNAHKINQGRMPVIDSKQKDFFFMERQEQVDIAATVAELITERLPKFFEVKPQDIQILCPMRKGAAGVEALNVRIQELLNPPMKGKNQVNVGENIIRVGDKVMQTVNNYQMEWVRHYEDGSFSAGEGVYNGDIGYVVGINSDTNTLTVRFEDDKTAIYTSSEFDELSLAYAISIHKSQGSEFDYVIMAISGGNYMIMTRNLFYTGVSRAKKGIVLVGSKENVKRMTENTFTSKRYSLLKELLLNQV